MFDREFLAFDLNEFTYVFTLITEVRAKDFEVIKIMRNLCNPFTAFYFTLQIQHREKVENGDSRKKKKRSKIQDCN